MPSSDDREILVRSAISAIMMLLQIVFMLLFASGGVMLLLLVGLTLLPFVAIFVGARRLLRSMKHGHSTRPDSDRDP